MLVGWGMGTLDPGWGWSQDPVFRLSKTAQICTTSLSDGDLKNAGQDQAVKKFNCFLVKFCFPKTISVQFEKESDRSEEITNVFEAGALDLYLQ